MKKLLMLVITALLLATLAGCTQTVADVPVKSEKPRVTEPEVEKTDTVTLVDGNTAFALDLYQVLKGEDGNLFYSPYSISAALAMTYAGARGDTEQQMAVPSFRPPPESDARGIQLTGAGTRPPRRGRRG